MATKKDRKLQPKPEPTVDILAKALEGRASLEHYSDERGTIVAFRIKDGLTFWVDFYELQKLVEDFAEVIKIRVKK